MRRFELVRHAAAVAFVVSILGPLGGCARRAPADTAAARVAGAPLPARPAMSRADLAAHRARQIERLRAYAEAGVFPQNPSPSPAPVHMFRDAEGHLCAVANLVHLDGLDAVVDRMAREHNDVVVADEASGPLHDWVLTSGLTNEEVRRIQGVGFPGGENAALLAFSERLRLQEYLRSVERELVAATDASLDVAVERLAAA